MRMRDLERASGVGRETIRFYIRERLLPEPMRASRNSASYSDEHVTRLRAIKRLQEERFLPLSVIRSLLDAEDGARWLGPRAYPRLDALLAGKLNPDGARRPLAAIMREQGFPDDFADGHVESGMIDVDDQGSISAGDAAILATLKALWDLGFDRNHGFMPEDMQMFVELIDWLVAQEMKMFFGHMPGAFEEAQAAEMATQGVGLINDLLAQLHNRAVLKKLGERRMVANDNSGIDS